MLALTISSLLNITHMKTLSFLFLALISFKFANPHELSPTTATITADNRLRVCFDIAGLGNVSQTNLTVNYTVTVTTTCTNPAGQIAPGQTKTSTSSQPFVVSVNNGRANDCVTTNAPIPGSCPNGKWTGTVSDASYSNVSISIGGKTFRTQ